MRRYIDADELYTEGYCLVRDIHINGALLRDCRSLLDVPTEDVQPVRHDPCYVCDGLEDGDTLYIHSEWDGGIGFDYIHDIHFCPKCGRRLPSFESKNGR